MPSEDTSSTLKEQTAKKICLTLQSDDKRARKQALIDFQTFLSNPNEDFSNQELRNIFTETHMYVLNGFRDQRETVREQAIKFMSFLIIDKLPLNDFYLTYVFPVLVERIGSVELIEESEEIRLELVKFVQAIILKYSNTEQLKPFLGDCVIILCEMVKDKHPAIKEASCICVRDLAEALPRDFHMQAENLVKPTITCFGHQRFRVRVEAIKAMGVIIMHSSYNGLNEAVGPIAERLFDQIPVVRRTVAQVAARWLLEYRDRYSFFHKILPLLLTGLNDEVDETRAEAHELWAKVGEQYQQENEKDLKDQMDFLLEPPKYYPTNLKRPNLGCRVLVQRNVSKLANALSYELTSWQEDIRVRCSQLLCSLALCAEDGLTQNLQDLLPAMYSASRDSDQRVVINIIQASEIIGVFVSNETWRKLVIPAIESGVHAGHLCVLAGLITGTPREYLCDSLEEITAVLADDSVCCTRKLKVQIELVKCVTAILAKHDTTKTSDVPFHIFKISIMVIALRDKEFLLTDHFLDDVCKGLGLRDRYALWSCHLGRLLKHIAVDPQAWTVVTTQRCVFETILIESGEAFGENLEAIGGILGEALHLEADAEARLKTFWALSAAFEKKDLVFKQAGNVTAFFDGLITDVFVPTLVWHAGRTAEALRTIAASCLHCALTPIAGVDLFVKPEILRNLFDKLLTLLLSLMEDASSRSRLLAIDCLNVIKMHMCEKGIWTGDDLIKIYPEILKRLDDPTERVRLNALHVLPQIFADCPEEFKEPNFKAHHELITDTLLTHFDDDDENVRKLVFGVLEAAGKINAVEVAKKIERHKPLLRNQDGCDEILKKLTI